MMSSKIMKIFLLIVGISIFGISVVVQTYADNTDNIYMYPIKPGTEEWKDLNSQTEKVEVCQIPDKILSEMSTDALIETCLSYPLFGGIMAYSNIQQGFERVSSRFNGLQKLLNQSDAGIKLFTKYKGIDPEGYDGNWSLEQKGNYAFQLIYIESLLAQQAILSSLQYADLISLLRESIQKFQSKQKHPEVYGSLSQTSVTFVIARTMKQLNENQFEKSIAQNDNFKKFIENPLFLDKEVLYEILNNAERIINHQ